MTKHWPSDRVSKAKSDAQCPNLRGGINEVS